MSTHFIPIPFIRTVPVHWSVEKDRGGNLIPENRRTTWTVPWCSEMMFDENWVPQIWWSRLLADVSAQAINIWVILLNGLATISRNKLRLIHKKAQGGASFTFRFTWTLFHDPYMGLYEGFLTDTGSVPVRWWGLGVGITDQLKWGIDLMIRACIPAQFMLGITAPIAPLYVKFCGQVDIKVTTKRPCPGMAEIFLRGGGSISLTIGMDLWFMWFDFGSVSIGFEIGMGMVTVGNRGAGWCWWIAAEEGNVRRRYWDRRRAPTKKCKGTNTQVCDYYVKGWISITILYRRIIFKFERWSKTKRIEWYLKLEVYRYWRPTRDWKVTYDKLFWLKKW